MAAREEHIVLKKIMEERAAIWAKMQALRATAEADKRNEFTAEERATWDEMEADLAAKSADIERLQRSEEFAKTLKPTFEAAADEVERTAKKPDEEYREAFLAWAKGGTADLEPSQRKVLRDGFIAADNENRALGIGTGAAGGYAVPAGFRDVLIETLKYFAAVRQVAMVITTDSGQSLPWPTINDTANLGAILAENTQITALDVALGQATLGAYMYTSKLVLVSWQLLQDSAVDIEGLLARQLGNRIGRIQNQHFTTGTGTGQPLGLISGNTTNLSTQAATGSTTKVTYLDLVAAMFKVDPSYRNVPDVKWMFSDTALASIRSLVDGQSRPLWEPSVQAGTPDTILGKPLVINNDIAVPAVNALVGAFGDFSQGYVIRDVLGVSTVRLDERYADFLQVGWFAYCRTDATVQNSAAYTVLKQAAS